MRVRADRTVAWPRVHGVEEQEADGGDQQREAAAAVPPS
jgi:hypothetical protein